MGKIRNRIANTLGIAPRTVGTASQAVVDTAKSALNLALDPAIGLGKTGSDIKQAIHKSFTEGPWYQRLRKIPTSLALSPFMAIEGTVETLRGTGVNACSSAINIIGNTLTNEWNAIKMMGKGEKFNFTTKKLEYKKMSPKNWLASLFKPKTEIDVEKNHLNNREKNIKNDEARLKKENEDLKKDKENREKEKEKSRKEMKDRREKEKEKLLQTLKEEREASNKEREIFKNEKTKLNEKIATLEKEKNDLELIIKNTRSETNKNTDKKIETPKGDLKTNKKEENKENKGDKAPIIKLNQNKDDNGVNSDENEEVKQAA